MVHMGWFELVAAGAPQPYKVLSESALTVYMHMQQGFHIIKQHSCLTATPNIRILGGGGVSRRHVGSQLNTELLCLPANGQGNI
jgi:hypothetical protein